MIDTHSHLFEDDFKDDIEACITRAKNNGIDKALNKKNVKGLYKKYCIDDKTEYVYEFHGEWKKEEERIGDI